MKIAPARAAAFLRDPGTARLVLLHGEDEGMIRQRADALTLQVAGSADDPFRVAWLADGDHSRLLEEASAIAMLGGRRVIRIRDVGDALLAALEAAIAAPGDSLLLLEAPGLTRRSKLLAAMEAADGVAAIACYPPEGDDLRSMVAARLTAAGIRADGDTLDWLRDHLGMDHASTGGEIEKLILYAGETRTLDLDAVRACIGDQGATSMDDAVFAATAGNLAVADRSIERALAEGVTPVALLRVLLGHFVRLHQARPRLDAGAGPDAAVEAMRPPVFWKRKKDMARALATWPLPRLSAAITEIRRVELACKQTAAPDMLLVRRLVTTLARQAEAARRR